MDGAQYRNSFPFTVLAALGFVGETTFREPLLLIGCESELRAAIDAHNGFVLKRHNVLQWEIEEE